MIRESLLMRRIQETLAASGKITVWRNNVGFDPERRIRYGLAVGSADLIGFLHGTGQFVGIEVKTAAGRLSPEQQAWARHVNGKGAVCVTFRSVEEATVWIGSK